MLSTQMPTSAWDGLEPSTVAQLSEELLRIEARVKAQQVAAARVLDASGLAKSRGCVVDRCDAGWCVRW